MDKRTNSGEQGDDMKAWKRPVIQEIRVGLEINLYFPAEL